MKNEKTELLEKLDSISLHLEALENSLNAILRKSSGTCEHETIRKARFEAMQAMKIVAGTKNI